MFLISWFPHRMTNNWYIKLLPSNNQLHKFKGMNKQHFPACHVIYKTTSLWYCAIIQLKWVFSSRTDFLAISMQLPPPSTILLTRPMSAALTIHLHFASTTKKHLKAKKCQCSLKPSYCVMLALLKLSFIQQHIVFS